MLGKSITEVQWTQHNVSDDTRTAFLKVQFSSHFRLLTAANINT